jgi:general secretion pathway protein N
MLAAALLTAVVFAPAAWLAQLVQGYTPVRLVYPHGSMWRGSALLAVSDGRQARLVPGRVSWRVTWSELWSGRVGVSLRHPALQPAVTISTNGRSLRLEPAQAQVSAAVLAALGAPFNTMRPGGTLHARWDAVELQRGRLAGLIQLDWENAQSALSPVAPLGDYRVVALGRGASAEARLTTLKGPLLLQAQGRLEQGRLRFAGSAEAQPEMRAALNGLIGILGRRVGDRAVFNGEL